MTVIQSISSLSMSSLMTGYAIALMGLLQMPAAAQGIIAEIPLSDKPVHAYVDRPGELYIRFASRIVHYDVNGKEAGTFMLAHPSQHFEPRDGSRMFLYNPINKLYGFTSFGKNPTLTLPEEYAIEPALVCSAGDNGCWILDRADFSCKKANLKKGQIDIEFKLPEKLQNESITAMREYQGFLFLATPSHLHIISTMGKLLKSLKTTSDDFDFLGEELYCRDNNRIIFFDLFDGTIRSEEINADILFVRLTDEQRYLIYSNRLVILAAQ